MSSLLTIHLFGAFRAERDGTPLFGLHLREGERLLAYFVLHNGEPVSTRELARQFWPAEARDNPGGEGDFPCVRQALRSLRQALGPDAERLTRPSRAVVRFDTAGIEADVLAFDARARAQEDEAGREAYDDWAAAVALYRGPLLRDWQEDWVKEARARRKRSYERILRRLIQMSHNYGDGAELERWTRLLLAEHPTDEETSRDLLRRLSAAGPSRGSGGTAGHADRSGAGGGTALAAGNADADSGTAGRTRTPFRAVYSRRACFPAAKRNAARPRYRRRNRTGEWRETGAFRL